jgi:hypothetical protein
VLQPVHAAQEGALARARGADDEDDLALGYFEVDALEGLDGAEVFRASLILIMPLSMVPQPGFHDAHEPREEERHDEVDERDDREG